MNDIKLWGGNEVRKFGKRTGAVGKGHVSTRTAYPYTHTTMKSKSILVQFLSYEVIKFIYIYNFTL